MDENNILIQLQTKNVTCTPQIPVAVTTEILPSGSENMFSGIYIWNILVESVASIFKVGVNQWEWGTLYSNFRVKVYSGSLLASSSGSHSVYTAPIGWFTLGFFLSTSVAFLSGFHFPHTGSCLPPLPSPLTLTVFSQMAYFQILRMEAAGSLKMLVNIYQTIWHHISEDSNVPCC